ncbi:MAG: hypothetical protein KDJ36_13370 [Hyphomicrobiaceae bacterium]|nr:hypothetical protein [Hyphomicrobiaceae bacterium]
MIVGGGLHTSVDILYRKGLRIVEGASFGLCTLRPSGLSVSFAPPPSERREISVHRLDRLKALARGDAPSAK